MPIPCFGSRLLGRRTQLRSTHKAQRPSQTFIRDFPEALLKKEWIPALHPGQEQDFNGSVSATVVLQIQGVPGTTYVGTGQHLALRTLPQDNPEGGGYYLVDEYNFQEVSNEFFDGGTPYLDSFEFYGPGPEQDTPAHAIPIANTTAMGTPPQIPTSLKFLSATVLPTGTTGGCTSGADYGIRVDVKYQLLDQANNPLKQGGLTPYEAVQFAGGKPSYNPIGGTTASDGTFHDVPLGLCSAAAISNATQLQIIYIDNTSQKVRQQTFTYNSTASGHGSMSNGNDVSAMR